MMLLVCEVSGSKRFSVGESSMSEKNETKKIKVQLYRSTICTPETHKNIVKTFGFNKLNQIMEKPDNAATQGVVAKVPHLLRIVR